MPLSPGSQVAGYKVVSLLGSGGMGEVYLVENPQLLRREALKVISLAGAHDPDFQRRFTNEARTTAALDHPSIISIHQYGINTDGTPWFTMNYLEGADLTHGAISPSDVIEVTTRVADASTTPTGATSSTVTSNRPTSSSAGTNTVRSPGSPCWTSASPNSSTRRH